MRIQLAAMAFVAIAVTGCGEGSAFDKEFKKGFREKYVATCAKSAGDAAPAGATIDFGRLCGCMADKLMANRSATELTNLPEADQKAAADSCVAELYPTLVPGKTPGTQPAN